MFKKVSEVIPDMEPKYSIGETLRLIGRTPLLGETAKVIEVWPSQKNVMYKLVRKNGKKVEVYEHMLERI